MKALTTAASVTRHMLGALTEALLVTAIIASLTFGMALATGRAPTATSALAKAGGGSGGPQSSVWIVQLSGSAPTAALTWGDPFTVGYSTKVSQPWALAECYPNSTTVLAGNPNADGSIWAEWFSVYPGGPSPQNFVLGDSVSPIWTGGGADCTVGLYKLSGTYNGALGFSNQTLLASRAFTAAP